MIVEFNLNGKTVTIEAQPHWTLLDVLRDQFGLIGTKKGCEAGECGACTVLINNENVNSCLTLIGQVEGKDVTTIEGLMKDGELDIVQKAFAEKGAVHCGYCTPGMIMSVKALLHKNPQPSRDEIKEAISGNLCRCTGYEQIIEAVEAIKEGLDESE
jgi:aerobic-type carbon monoxide dehydrogenase small subunit (CoxS/CutS family)